MILEACERPAARAGELALEQDVADHAPIAGLRPQRQHARSGQLGARAVAVEAAEELVAAADGEQGGARRDHLGQLPPTGGEVGRHERLLAILSAADVEQVDIRWDRLVEPDRDDVELDASPRRAPLEHGDVAAIGVDVQVVGVEVAAQDAHPLDTISA